MKFKIWTAVMMLSLMGLVGCAAKPEPPADNSTGIIKESNPATGTVEEDQGIAVGEPAPGSNAKISAEAAEQIASEKKIENVKSIILKDLDGNTLDRTFSEDEVKTIVAAYNESYIQDTAYIEMLAGNTMVITLEDGAAVTITSYGDENNIVATSSNGNTYHLGAPAIAKILLEKVK